MKQRPDPKASRFEATKESVDRRVAAGRYADAPLEVNTSRVTKPSGLVRFRLDALPPAKTKVKGSR